MRTKVTEFLHDFITVVALAISTYNRWNRSSRYTATQHYRTVRSFCILYRADSLTSQITDSIQTVEHSKMAD